MKMTGMNDTAPRASKVRRALWIFFLSLLLLGGVALAVIFAFRDQLYANNALYLLQRGRTDEALQRAEQARKMGLGQRQYASLIMRIQMKRRDYAAVLQAASALRKEGTLSRDESDWAMRAALELDSPPLLREWLGSAVRPSPNAMNLRAGVLQQLAGNAESAVETLSKANAESSNLAYFCDLWLGRALRISGQPVQALHALAQAEAARAHSVTVLREQTACWLDLKDEDEFAYHAAVLRNARQQAPESKACREWMQAVLSGRAAGAPPREMALCIQSMPLPDKEQWLSIGQAMAANKDMESLLQLAARMEQQGNKNSAMQLYQLAGAIMPPSFAAQWQVIRMALPAPGLPELASLAHQTAQQLQFNGHWFLPEQMQRVPSGAFDGGLYSNGSVAIKPKATPGRQRLWLIVSATTVNDIGAWAELRCGDQVQRFFVANEVPRVISRDVFFAANDEPQCIQISFLNDESDPTHEHDRNLYIYGAGMGEFGSGGQVAP